MVIILHTHAHSRLTTLAVSTLVTIDLDFARTEALPGDAY